MLSSITSVRILLAGLLALEITAAAVAKEGSPGDGEDWRPRNVAIVVHQNAEPLDFVGPGEVFGAAARAAGVPGKPAFIVYTVAPTADPVRSMFMTVQPDYTIEDCPTPDIIVVPGGDSMQLIRSVDFMNWFRLATNNAEMTMSVCTGARVLAVAGMLDGKTATTHHGALQALRSTFPDVEVIDNVRFVEHPRLITTAGVSAGIDGALHVVGRVHGSKVAMQVARFMEYDWRPDLDVFNSYPKRNPALSAVEELQNDLLLAAGERDSAAIMKAAVQLIEHFPEDAQLWYQLGSAQLAERELDAAAESLRKAAELGPDAVRASSFYNLACTYALLGHETEALRALQSAVGSGYDNANHARADTDLAKLRDSEEFDEILAGIK